MKINDIFELEFEGQPLRFRLAELKPYFLAVQTVDIDPPLRRSGNVLLAALPKAALATDVDGQFVTTEIGDRWVKKFANDLYYMMSNSISSENELFEVQNNKRKDESVYSKARRNSLLWLTACKKMEQNEAETLVDDIINKLPSYNIKYLVAVARWVANGELDITNEEEILRARRLFSNYSRSHLVPEKGNGDEIAYDGMCFKRFKDGQLADCLWTLNEVEEVLKPWD